jgi:pyridoxamine---pyruvate transaminase
MANNTIARPVLTLSAGPVDAYPAVLRGLSSPIFYDFDPWFQGFYERVNEKATAALRSNRPAVILQGEPVLGLEAAAASLISRRDVVLNLASGVYGKGFGYWSARHHKEMVEIEVPYNEAIDPAAVKEAFRKRPDIKIVSVVHHDTPSGTINPVKEIGRIVADHDALMIVDAVSSWGGMDIHPEDCHADIFVTGPNKCLGGSPGLTLLYVSDRAWRHMEANEAAPRASMLSILDWREARRSDKPFPFTPSVAEINGLDAALENYLAEGPEKVWARHALTARACRRGIVAMGLSLWPAREEIAADTVTAVKVPAGIEDAALRDAVRRLYGVAFSAGRGQTLGKLIRIGHMGPVANPIYAVAAVAALGGALESLGHKADVGAGVEAVLAEINRAA